MRITESGKNLLLPAFIVAAVSFAVYLNTLGNGFVYDDNGQVLRNIWIKDVKYIPDIFSSSVWSFQSRPSISSYYRPMMHVMYMIDYHIFGFQAWGFHLVNVMFHAMVSVMVFLLASKLISTPEKSGATPPQRNFSSISVSACLSAPFIASLLFATHPIHTEAVAWIAAIPELSYTFFSLLSIYCFLRSGAGMKNRAYIFSVASFSLALLCKESSVTLPIVLFACDLAFRKPGERFSVYVVRYLPFMAVIGIYLVARSHALGGLEPMKAYRDLNTYRFIINSFPLFFGYLEKLIFPVNLNVFHVFPPISSVFETKGMLGLIVAIACCLLGVIAYRKNRTAFFCLVLVIVPLLPAFYVPAVSQAPFSERYLYLPSVGFVVLVALAYQWWREKMPRQSIVPLLLIAVLAGAYSIQTIRRNPVWKDDLTLFTDIVRKSPDAELPNGMLGLALMDARRYDEAAEQFRKTLRLNPNSVNAYYNLGLTLLKKGRPAEAVPEFKRVLAITPNDPDARINLAISYATLGVTDKAIEQFRILVASNVASPEAYLDLGVALGQQGLTKEAIECYQKALAINPGYAEAHFNLGKVYADSGQMDKAMEQYESAVRLRPGNPFFRNMLGITYGQKGAYDKAVEQFEAAVKLAPSEPAYRRNLDRASGMKNSPGP